MQDSSYTKSFLVESGEVGDRQFVDDSLSVQPCSHNMVISKRWKVLVSQCNRCINDRGVRDLDSGDEASEGYHNEVDIEISRRGSEGRKVGKLFGKWKEEVVDAVFEASYEADCASL